MAQSTETTYTATLEALAEAGHLTRQFKILDAEGREVTFDNQVGWHVPETGDRALSPVTRHVAYVSGWIPEDAISYSEATR